jgi:cystathionine beta-lyase/cystathionine gamma-synthase
MNTSASWGVSTQLAHDVESSPHGAVVPPLYQNSLYLFDTMDELLGAMGKTPNGPPHHYSRVSNPTLSAVETKLARLEGVEACKLVNSGMTAMAAALMSTVQAGAHVVIPDTAYGPVRVLLNDYLSRFGVTHTLVTGTCVEETLDAVRPETTCIYLESPTSLLFRLQDIPAITRFAREKGIATMIDNTYNTPLHFQPASMGVDIVCHSCSKYIGGHSDVVAGAICTSSERMDRLVRQEVTLLVGALQPYSAWLLGRGLRTLAVRLPRHMSTANTVAAWLEDRPAVERVFHVGLSTFPQADLAKKLFKGTGGLFSFHPRVQEPDRVKAFCDKLAIFGRGISWGGHESLVVALPVKTLDHPEPRWIVRLFCGLEEPEDLIADLDQAMEGTLA